MILISPQKGRKRYAHGPLFSNIDGAYIHCLLTNAKELSTSKTKSAANLVLGGVAGGEHSFLFTPTSPSFGENDDAVLTLYICPIQQLTGKG